MFRRALRLGARVSVASCAAVVPATAAACLSDSTSSVTRAAAFRDFAVNTGGPGANVGYHRALHATADKEDLDKVQKMMQEKESVLFRVIDTPGLHDI